MRRHLIGLITLLVVSMVIFSGSVYSAPLNPEVKQALHDVNEVIIRGEGDTSSVWDLQEKPESIDIIYIAEKATKSDFSTSQWSILTNWVKGGGTIWVDTNGNSAFLKSFGFSVLETADGGVSTSASAHPVLTDVRKVRTEEGAIIGRYDVPLLESNGDVVAAINYSGSGLIIATPIIKTEKKDGNRFKANIYEYGAGYPVPPSVVPDDGQKSTAAEITLTTGESFSGSLLTNTLHFRTPYGEFSFDRFQLSFISLSSGKDILQLRRGDRLIGSLLNGLIDVRTTSGRVRSIEVRNLSRIIWREE